MGGGVGTTVGTHRRFRSNEFEILFYNRVGVSLKQDLGGDGVVLGEVSFLGDDDGFFLFRGYSAYGATGFLYYGLGAYVYSSGGQDTSHYDYDHQQFSS